MASESSEAGTAANPSQVEYWNGPVGDRWARLQTRIDALFAPVSALVIDRAVVAPGERVLDIGCGCGGTSLDLARRVGPDGTVLGIDISRPMIDVAASRVPPELEGRLSFRLADAAVTRFDPGFDLAFSRFGVMFFEDPVAAFATIRSDLRPGGRLAFACWRPFKENSWFTLSYFAAKPHLPPPEPVDPDAPGPFAFADPDRVRRILGAAGFGDIAIDPFDCELVLGRPGRLDEAFDIATQLGPTSRLLATGTPDQQAAAVAAIRAALAAAEGPNGIELGARMWFVSARA